MTLDGLCGVMCWIKKVQVAIPLQPLSKYNPALNSHHAE